MGWSAPGTVARRQWPGCCAYDPVCPIDPYKGSLEPPDNHGIFISCPQQVGNTSDYELLNHF